MSVRFTEKDLERAYAAYSVRERWTEESVAQALAELREECAKACEKEGMWSGEHFASLIRGLK